MLRVVMALKKKSANTNTLLGLGAFFLVVLAITGFLMLRTVPPKIKTGPIVSHDEDCSAPSIDWMEVSQEVSHEVLADLASKFAAAANSDAARFSSTGVQKLTGKMDTSLGDVVKQTT